MCVHAISEAHTSLSPTRGRKAGEKNVASQLWGARRRIGEQQTVLAKTLFFIDNSSQTNDGEYRGQREQTGNEIDGEGNGKSVFGENLADFSDKRLVIDNLIRSSK